MTCRRRGRDHRLGRHRTRAGERRQPPRSRRLRRVGDDGRVRERKNRIVVYAGDIAERPDALYAARDIRSVAHLKMLQSVAARLNWLNSGGRTSPRRS